MMKKLIFIFKSCIERNVCRVQNMTNKLGKLGNRDCESADLFPC